MAFKLRIPALALLTVSLCLQLAIIATSSRTLDIYHTQKTTNRYLLPLYPSLFDLRAPTALLATSIITLILNLILLAALLIPRLPTLTIALPSTLLSTLAALLAAILPSIFAGQTANSTSYVPGANTPPPTRYTLQAWSCLWRDAVDQSVPGSLDSVCDESRFGYWAGVPSLVLQVLLVGLVVGMVVAERRMARRSERGWRLENGEAGEKENGSEVELNRVRVEVKNGRVHGHN